MKHTSQHKLRYTILSAVILCVLIVLGGLSVRQYLQIRTFQQAQKQQQHQQVEQTQLAVRLISQIDQLQEELVVHDKQLQVKPEQEAVDAIQRDLSARLMAQLVELKAQLQASQQQLQASQQQLQGALVQVQETQKPIASEDIIAQVAGGICLIQGEYRFLDPVSKKPLRYLESQDANSLIESNDPDDPLFPVSVSGQGDELVVQYTGTGFLIDANGYILTNRHVTVPWESSDDYQHVLAAGYEPQRVLFRAFFPDQTEPFELELISASEQNDLALLQTDLRSQPIPVLDCVDNPEDLKMGQTVLVIGYPTGFDAMLARLSPEQMEAILGSEGLTFKQMGYQMAKLHLIWPIATRGMCSRVRGGKIVYDAQTAIGGSGAPVLGSNGKVVAINTALMKGFSGSNFGISADCGLALLTQITGDPVHDSTARTSHLIAK